MKHFNGSSFPRFSRLTAALIFSLVLNQAYPETPNLNNDGNFQRHGRTVIQDTSGNLVAASYPGGSHAWTTHLIRNMRYPPDAMNRRVQGRVIVQFDVDEKGRLSKLEAISGAPELQKEAIRVIKDGGRWTPAIENGHPVKSQRLQAITFLLESPATTVAAPAPGTALSDSSQGNEIESSYPGGPSAWMRYLNRTFRYPIAAQERRIQGTVVVQFEIDPQGGTANFSAVYGPTEGGLREEAIRVIKNSGNWLPATKNGIAVRSYKKQPITFMLEHF